MTCVWTIFSYFGKLKKLGLISILLVPSCVEALPVFDLDNNNPTASGGAAMETPASGGLGSIPGRDSGGAIAVIGSGGSDVSDGGATGDPGVGGELMMGGASGEDEPCWFERVGYGRRCTSTYSTYWDKTFTDSNECAEECLADKSCTSIIDYSVYMGDSIGCFVTTGECDPGVEIWSEEDGAFEYVKVCGSQVPHETILPLPQHGGVDVTAGDSCHYEAVQEDYSCEGALNPSTVHDEALKRTSLESCMAACDATTDCSAVQDVWATWEDLDDDGQCLLHMGTCETPVENVPAGRTFKKVCD